MTSIIIPTWNAARQIGGLLTALKSQTVQCEIIVIDSSSSDATADIAVSLGAEVLSVARKSFGHGETRALAAQQARGSILVYFTQDAVPCNEHAVKNLLTAFQDHTVAAAYGRQVPCPEATAFAAHLRLFNYPEISCVRSIMDKERYGIRTPFLSNSFAAYRKNVLKNIGGFRKKMIMGEDTCAGAELLLAGYKIAYVADAAVYHSHNLTVREEFKRYFDIGVFHTREQWVLEAFGNAEGEGRRYVASEVRYLAKRGKMHLLPELLVRNCLKYAGYRLGRNYRKIPRSLIGKISLHRDWWDSGTQG